MILRAHGIKNGEKLEVEYNNGNFLFNGGESPLMNEEIQNLLRQRHAVGGTFFPDVKSDLNIINVVENWFFDKPVRAIEVSEENIETMESETGRIY